MIVILSQRLDLPTANESGNVSESPSVSESPPVSENDRLRASVMRHLRDLEGTERGSSHHLLGRQPLNETETATLALRLLAPQTAATLLLPCPHRQVPRIRPHSLLHSRVATTQCSLLLPVLAGVDVAVSATMRPGISQAHLAGDQRNGEEEVEEAISVERPLVLVDQRPDRPLSLRRSEARATAPPPPTPGHRDSATISPIFRKRFLEVRKHLICTTLERSTNSRTKHAGCARLLSRRRQRNARVARSGIRSKEKQTMLHCGLILQNSS